MLFLAELYTFEDFRRQNKQFPSPITALGFAKQTLKYSILYYSGERSMPLITHELLLKKEEDLIDPLT